MGATRSGDEPRPLLGGGLRLGALDGVPIRVHWSVVVILTLIAWGLAGQVLPTAYPGAPLWAYAAAGVLVAALFLLCLLAHEIAHAVVARRCGVHVYGITLWMLGGVAQLTGEAKDPGAEMRIAGIGPLVSLLLGGAFAAATVGAAAAGGPQLLVGALTWLAGMNLLLAAFNALPGAPLDGGRLLRALLWRWRGDRLWATSAAATAGRALGFGLVVVAFVELLLLGNLSALWLALVGWFIAAAAAAEERGARDITALAGMRVADVMTPTPDVVDPNVTVAEFIDHHLFTYQHSTFPLVEHGRLVGLVTLAGVRTVPPSARASTPLRAVAQPLEEVVIAGPEAPLTDLLSTLGTGSRRALVMSNGSLVGIVTPADLSRALDIGTIRAASSRSLPSGR